MIKETREYITEHIQFYFINIRVVDSMPTPLCKLYRVYFSKFIIKLLVYNSSNIDDRNAV